MNGTGGEPEDVEVSFTDQPAPPAAEAPEPPPTRPHEDAEHDTSGPREKPKDSTGPTTMREDLGTLAEEGRKLLEAVETRFVAPLVRSYPEVARRLGTAGRELAAAYRAAVHSQEQAWRDHPGPAGQQEKITVERVDSVEPPEPEKQKD